MVRFVLLSAPVLFASSLLLPDPAGEARAQSTSVTGEQSSLYDTCGPARWTAMMACPASSAAFVNMSIISLPIDPVCGISPFRSSLLLCPLPVK